MNIEFRSSGSAEKPGRGEYEFAGKQGSLQVQDIFDLPILIEVIPGSAIRTRSHCIRESGKPRIRQIETYRNTHPYALIAAAMMLPKPQRDLHRTGGKSLLEWEEFVVQTIRVDVTRQNGNLLVRPVIVRLANGKKEYFDIRFADRMARVVNVWTAAATRQDELSDAVRRHATAFTSITATQEELAKAFTSLHNTLGKPDGDMLPMLETTFKIDLSVTLPASDLLLKDDSKTLAEDTSIDPTQARIERVREWRLSSVRRGSAVAFRRDVKEAYGFQCMFSGQRLPLTEITSTPGVDSAHILPWSRFDLDVITNGICLNKQCHWAFDEGLLRLSFDDSINSYVVSIPESVRPVMQAANFDLDSFFSVTGPVPRHRLPAEEVLWPSKRFIADLNLFMDGMTV